MWMVRVEVAVRPVGSVATWSMVSVATYSDHAFQGMLQKSEDQHDAVAKLFKAAGGKMLSIYLTMGEYDFLTIAVTVNGEKAEFAVAIPAS